MFSGSVWLCLAREKIVIRVFRVKLLDDIHEKDGNRNRSEREVFRLWRPLYVEIRFSLLLVVDTLDGFVDADGLVRQRNVPLICKPHSSAYRTPVNNAIKNSRCLPVQSPCKDTLDLELALDLLREKPLSDTKLFLGIRYIPQFREWNSPFLVVAYSIDNRRTRITSLIVFTVSPPVLSKRSAL